MLCCSVLQKLSLLLDFSILTLWWLSASNLQHWVFHELQAHIQQHCWTSLFSCLLHPNFNMSTSALVRKEVLSSSLCTAICPSIISSISLMENSETCWQLRTSQKLGLWNWTALAQIPSVLLTYFRLWTNGLTSQDPNIFLSKTVVVITIIIIIPSSQCHRFKEGVINLGQHPAPSTWSVRINYHWFSI